MGTWDLRGSGIPIITVKSDTLEAQARAFTSNQNAVKLAVMRTLNRAGAAGFTAVRKELRRQTGLGASDIGRTRGLYSRPARPFEMKYEVVARSQWTPLGYFKPKEVNPHKKGGGVAASPWNRRTFFRGFFMVRMRSGYVGVFRRQPGQAKRLFTSKVTGKRYKAAPLQERWGPSLSKELVRDQVPIQFEARALEVAKQRLPHELQFALAQMSKGKKGP